MYTQVVGAPGCTWVPSVAILAQGISAQEPDRVHLRFPKSVGRKLTKYYLGQLPHAVSCALRITSARVLATADNVRGSVLVPALALIWHCRTCSSSLSSRSLLIL